jgi:hypothetical protein
MNTKNLNKFEQAIMTNYDVTTSYRTTGVGGHLEQ